MSPLRTVIFVDGQNFRSNLRQFSFRSGDEYPSYQLEERHFHWREFFTGVIDKFNEATHLDHRLVRVYWYHAASITPWSESVRLAQYIIDNYDVPGLTMEEITAAAKEWYDRERQYFENLRERVFSNLQRDTDFLEFKYVGQYAIRPYQPYRIERRYDTGDLYYLGTRLGEKGVDIGIAVDMIAKMPNYDVAVLISGDADFMPVVSYLKDNLRQVYQFSIAKDVATRTQYLSAWLQRDVDCFQIFDELELLDTYLNREAPMPPAISQEVDARIFELKEALEYG